ILQSRLDQSFPLLKERFLYRLVSDSSTLETLAERKDYYQWYDLEALYQVVVAALPQAWSEMDRFSMGEFLKGQVETQDEVFFNRMNHIVLLLQDRDEETLKKRVKGLIDSIYGVASQFERKMPSIGCGEIASKLKHLERSYKGACSAVDYSRSMGLNQVVTVEEIRKRESPSPEELNRYNQDIIEQLKDGRSSESLETLKSMTAYLETHYESPRELTVIFLLLYSRISSFLNEMELILPPEKVQAPEPPVLESLDGAQEFFTGLIGTIGEQIGQRRNDVLHSRIDRAKSIIQDRFRDKDFSLQDICRELFLSTSQFSVLFKEGTDQTFVEYLTTVRMTEAKRLLLNTDMKSYEIAEEIGYSDPRYFSIIFKKHCGMTAMEYRRTRET
ncbi:MAG: helix-turn-helix domain-containing protein, partial [Spirochaetales bacterium]|nr:helix-turn-helix domain-containing protein [Spirochaetales bacterium]